MEDSKLSLGESQVFSLTILGVAENFKKWLAGQLSKNKWSYEALGNLIGVSHGAVGGWARGKYLPDPPSIKRLAKVTHVDVIWLYQLIGYLDPEDGSGQVMSGQTAELLGLFNELSDDDQEEEISTLRMRVERRKRGQHAKRASSGANT